MKYIWVFFSFFDNIKIFALFLGHRGPLMWSQINVAATHLSRHIVCWGDLNYLKKKKRKKKRVAPFFCTRLFLLIFVPDKHRSLQTPLHDAYVKWEIKSPLPLSLWWWESVQPQSGCVHVCAAVLCVCVCWGRGGLGVCCNELSSILVLHIPINLSLSATFTNKCCNVIHVDNYQQSVSNVNDKARLIRQKGHTVSSASH